MLEDINRHYEIRHFKYRVQTMLIEIKIDQSEISSTFRKNTHFLRITTFSTVLKIFKNEIKF